MITFDNWHLASDGAVLAMQFDNKSRLLEVLGDLPQDWTWTMIVAVGQALDVISMDVVPGGLEAVLTAETLSLSGYYSMQLKGVRGDVVRHTNVIRVPVQNSLSGDSQWPTLPTEFSQAEQRIAEYNAHPPVPGPNGYWMLWDVNLDKYVESEFPLPSGGGGGTGNVWSQEIAVIKRHRKPKGNPVFGKFRLKAGAGAVHRIGKGGLLRISQPLFFGHQLGIHHVNGHHAVSKGGPGLVHLLVAVQAAPDIAAALIHHPERGVFLPEVNGGEIVLKERLVPLRGQQGRRLGIILRPGVPGRMDFKVRDHLGEPIAARKRTVFLSPDGQPQKEHFIETGNTVFGIQNLAREPDTGNYWFTTYESSEPYQPKDRLYCVAPDLHTILASYPFSSPYGFICRGGGRFYATLQAGRNGDRSGYVYEADAACFARGGTEDALTQNIRAAFDPVMGL